MCVGELLLAERDYTTSQWVTAMKTISVTVVQPAANQIKWPLLCLLKRRRCELALVELRKLHELVGRTNSNVNFVCFFLFAEQTFPFPFSVPFRFICYGSAQQH